MSVNYTLRESGNERPTPTGEFDGHSRASLMRDLLAKADAEAEPATPKPPILERLLGNRSLASWIFGGEV